MAMMTIMSGDDSTTATTFIPIAKRGFGGDGNDDDYER